MLDINYVPRLRQDPPPVGYMHQVAGPLLVWTGEKWVQYGSAEYDAFMRKQKEE